MYQVNCGRTNFSLSYTIYPKSGKKSKKVEALTLENHKKFMKELAKGYDKYTDILYILIETGMRVGEVLSLDRQSIDLANKTIRIDKTLTKDKNGKVKLVHKAKTSAGMRTIPIPDLLVKVLSKYNLKLGYLFLKPDGIFINQSTINSHVKKFVKMQVLLQQFILLQGMYWIRIKRKL